MHHRPVNRHTGRQAEQPPGYAKHYGAGGHHGQNLRRCHPQRLQHRGVAGTFAGVQQHRVEHARHGDQSQHCGQHHHHRVQEAYKRGGRGPIGAGVQKVGLGGLDAARVGVGVATGLELDGVPDGLRVGRALRLRRKIHVHLAAEVRRPQQGRAVVEGENLTHDPQLNWLAADQALEGVADLEVRLLQDGAGGDDLSGAAEPAAAADGDPEPGRVAAVGVDLDWVGHSGHNHLATRHGDHRVRLRLCRQGRHHLLVGVGVRPLHEDIGDAVPEVDLDEVLNTGAQSNREDEGRNADQHGQHREDAAQRPGDSVAGAQRDRPRQRQPAKQTCRRLPAAAPGCGAHGDRSHGAEPPGTQTR